MREISKRYVAHISSQAKLIQSGGSARGYFKNYAKFLIEVFFSFRSVYVQCSYIGLKYGELCVCSSATHVKGHQDCRGYVFADGPFRSTFNAAFGDKWVALIADHLDTYQKELTYSIENGGRGTSNLLHMQQSHSRRLESFFESFDSTEPVRSHTTCLCCLMQMPKHPLPCGHVLCTECIRSFGKVCPNRVTWEMPFCPLHRSETEGKWLKPWIIKSKPAFAGVRLLSLDGYV